MKPERNALPERDPQNDPQVGDILTTPAGKFRKVWLITHSGREIHYTTDTNRSSYCWISTWQEWCRKNKATVKQ